MEKYLISPEETIIKEFNYEKNEINTEMLLEAWMIDFISKNGFEGEKYDYVTHQVIASPFKPLAYIDKMDIFAYGYLENFPDTEKPIEKYMVIELKKGKATKDFPLQLMRYVDWISREYAAGDYSLIKAVGIAKGYPKGMQKILDEQCKRSYLSDLHPNTTSQWNDLSLYEYSMNQTNQLQIEKSNIFDSKEHMISGIKSLKCSGKNKNNRDLKIAKFIIQMVDGYYAVDLKAEHIICEKNQDDELVYEIGNILPVVKDRYKDKDIDKKLPMYKEDAMVICNE